MEEAEEEKKKYVLISSRCDPLTKLLLKHFAVYSESNAHFAQKFSPNSA